MINSIKLKFLVGFIALGLSMSLAPRLCFGGHDDDGHGHGHGNQHEKGDHGDHGHGKGGGEMSPKHGKHHKHGGDYDGDDYHYTYRGPYFTSERVTEIRNFYTPEEIERLPPGLRKHLERTGHLPPGLEKKLVVNEPLPPGYLDYMVPAPPQLTGMLGPLPPDSSLYLYNGDAVLVNPKTQAVLDIFRGALTLGGY